MKKSCLLFGLFCLFQSLVFAQKEKFGKYNPNEIVYAQVDFEPEADAVVLFEEGHSKFVGKIFETNYHFRIKVLKESGVSRGDARIRFYSGDDRIEEISGIKAQVANFEGGQEQIFKVEKDQIFLVDLGNGFKEYRITFPNVKVGSILEWTYNKTDKNITFLDGWTFQNDIPTILSTYSITMIPQLEYKMIGQGYKYTTASEKTSNNGTYSWTLRKLNSLKGEPYMKNFGDYKDRVEFQLSRYQKSISEWVDVLMNWTVLGNEILDGYKEKGYNRNILNDPALGELTFPESSDLEKAKKAYYYLQNVISLRPETGFVPNQSLQQLLKKRGGSPLEVNLALMGILNSLGISCQPILVGSKGSGRSELVSFPFLNQFNSIMLIATVEGQKYYLDLEDPLAPFGYVDLDKHVKSGLLLERDKSQLVPIEIKHNSNSIFFTQMRFDEEKNVWVEGSLRKFYYEGFVLAQKAKQLENANEPLEKLFSLEPTWEVTEIKADDQLKENNFTNTNFKIKIPMDGGAESDLLMVSPFKITTFGKNPFTQEQRNFPVDFGFAFNETYNTILEIPEGWELDDYPLNENISMKNNEILFFYNTVITEGKIQINARIEVKKPIIDVRQYGNLKYFMETVATKLSSPVILKKVAAAE
jgi:hypothetical protein